MNTIFFFFTYFNMNSQLIELREHEQYNEGGLVDPIPGSFNVELDKNIVVNNNDVIQIRSAFLDSRAESSGKITIDSDTKDVVINHFLYITNFRSDPFRSVAFNDALPADDKGVPNGGYYILSSRAGPPGLNFKRITTITFNIDPERIRQNSFGGFNITYTYKTAQSYPNTVTKTISFPSTSTSTPSGRGVRTQGQAIINGDIIFVSETGDDTKDFSGVISDSELRKKNCKGQPQVNTVVANINQHLAPIKFTTSFTLEEADYTPEQLARVITDKMVTLVEFPDGTPSSTILNGVLEPITCATAAGADVERIFPVKNKFLTSTQQLRNDPFFGLGNPSSLEFVSNDGQSILNIIADSTHPNYLVGASEMALIFSETSQKFEFQNLHTSHFNGSSQPVIRYFNTNTNKSFVTSAVGGVLFQSLEPKELWYDLLGFDSSILCEPDQPTLIASLGGGADLLISLSSFNGMERGVNITSDLSGIDASTIKANFKSSAIATQQEGIDIVSYASVIATEQTTGTATLGITSITANTTIEKSTYKDGYYLIKIEGLPRQDLVNMPSQSVQAIVSKYFSAGSFLIMEGGSGSMSYKHIGEPFYLSDLKVMITEPDGSRPENLGTNNTVFLEIIRDKSDLQY